MQLCLLASLIADAAHGLHPCTCPPLAAAAAAAAASRSSRLICKEQPSREDRERMINQLFDVPVELDRTPPSTEIPSHMTLATDDTWEPELARFTYVDESTCIGCKNCAFVARNTFFMEDVRC